MRGTPLRHQGNDSLFMAVEMSLISTLAGVPLHVHAEGLRGTGKTTVMRWAKRFLPSIERIPGCPYQCDPAFPHCPLHSRGAHGGRGSETLDVRDVERVPMPFVEIGHGAKLGTILGSIDLARLTNPSRPEAALLPGSIPMANRGIIFVDEVNRLAETAPEITDVLLSVMGTKPGSVKIEEVGLPACEIEVTASVWAASNPDEDPGPLEEIRRQLADRFDLVVPVQRPTDPAVVERLLHGPGADSAGTAGAAGFAAAFDGLPEKAAKFKDVRVPAEIVRYVANLYVHRNVESLRAVEALETASRLCAAMRGKDAVSFEEVLAVIPLVLRHRVDPATLTEILKDLELRKAAGVQAERQGPPKADPGSAGATEDRDPVALEDRRKTVQEEENVRKVAPPQPGTGPGPGPGQDPGDKAGWFHRLADRLRRPRAGQAPRADGGRIPSVLPDPALLPPTSPPDRARRISSMAWEELVLPPEWRNDPS